MIHNVYVCTECRVQLIPCKCRAEHRRIAAGLCNDCRVSAHKPTLKVLQDVERLADHLMVHFQDEIRGGEGAVDMAIRILDQVKARPALVGNSAPQHGRMPGAPAGVAGFPA